MFWVASAGVLAAGCVRSADDQGDGSVRGTPSEITYMQGCFFGCPLEQPLLTGSHQRINVGDADDVAGVAVSSSDDSVADFGIERNCYCERKDNGARIEIAEDADCTDVADKHCDNTVLVHGKHAGKAELELKHDAKALDHAEVLVRDADRARVQATYPDRLGPESVSSIELAVGDQLQLDLDFYDSDGQKLLASDGVSWSVDDDSIAIVTAWLIGSGKHVDAGTSVMLEAKAEGQTKLTIAVPGLERSLDVTIASK